MSRLSAEHLRSLRNDIPIGDLIQKQLDLPSKHRDGFLRFLCPLCNEFNTAVNPKTNLGRCFRCLRNFNPIDLVMAVQGCSFLNAVKYLENPTPPASSDRQISALLRRR